MFKEIEIAKSVVLNKPLVVLTQIENDLWDVTVGNGASTTWETLSSAVNEYLDSVLEYQFSLERRN